MLRCKVYIYGAHGKAIQVSIRLFAPWYITACYPVCLCQRHEITWHINSSEDGQLQGFNSTGDLKIPYLFYEMASQVPVDSHPALLASNEAGLHNAIHNTWTSQRLCLCNGTEMQLPRATFIQYLENIARNAFCMDDNQRADWITAILTSLTHSHVMFRFLTLEEIMKAATIALEPGAVVGVAQYILTR